MAKRLFKERVKKLHEVSLIADLHLTGEDKRKAKQKIREAELDNIFEAMSAYC